MTESGPGPTLPWLVVRQDDNGNRYRVGRYATRTEAEQVADRLHARGTSQLYVVERTGTPRRTA
ncbi:SPOR domain-containing protein [Streptomyces sp. NPDC057702]|uniref:SPOR domain-containing protein n=1 Tax=unclassified Streptomyces TaxID=2593676 RepID=UPI0036ACEC31